MSATLNSVLGVNPNCLYHVVNMTFWKQLQDVTAVLNARLKAPIVSSKALQKVLKSKLKKPIPFVFQLYSIAHQFHF